MHDPVLGVMAVVGFVLLGLGYVLLPFALRERRRLDEECIREEAARRDCRVLSIGVRWLWFRGPFVCGRWRRYRVDCRGARGDTRRADVLLGPRRRWDPEEVLTWRWRRAPASEPGGDRSRPGGGRGEEEKWT